MAKPRKQKAGEQQQSHNKPYENLIRGSVLHQKLCLSIDVRKRRIFGHTEMKIAFPESGLVGVHAENMTIGSILVNGEPAEYELFHDHLHESDGNWDFVSCPSSAAETACATYISSLDREMIPNLIISCQRVDSELDGLKCQESGENASTHSPVDSKNNLNGNTDIATQENVKLVRINYCLEQAEAAIHFGDNLVCADNQIRRAHCWFPCMYGNLQRCCYNLEFTVDADLVAVSNGNLLYQMLTDDVPPRKIFVYELRVPVCAGWISLAVAPFEIFPDPHNSNLSHMCLQGKLSMLCNTVGFFHTAFSHYEEYLSATFPFGSYKQVFVPPESSASSVNVSASMCVFSSEVLFDEKVMDKTVETRIKLAYALAKQWFGGYVVAETANDEWLLDGLAGFLTDSFIRKFLGNNEARYRRYKANSAVCEFDVSGASALSSSSASKDLRGTQRIGLYGKIRSWKAVAVLQMLEKQMGPESFRKILQIIVSKVQDTTSFRTLSTKEFRHQANKVGNLERPFLKEFFPRWVGSSGCPVLRLGFSYIKRKNVIELAVLRTSTVATSSLSNNLEDEGQEGDTSWPGMMSIRVHELDGVSVSDHPILPMSGEILQLLEIQLHSRLGLKRFQKTKKGMKGEGSDDNNGFASAVDVQASLDLPLLWIRADPEMEYLAQIHFHQPVLMWINQLDKDKDVVAQSEAIKALRTLPQHSFSVINALNNFLNDSKVFWRVRIEAAYALAGITSEESDWAGLLQLIKFYKSRRFDADIGLPKPNNFNDVSEYFVLEAIPLAIAQVRSSGMRSPREAVEFVLQLLKYNDNSGNPYSDVYWVAVLVESVGELEFEKQHIPLLSSILKRIDRLLQFDRLLPSHNGILSVACIHTLAQIASKASASIPLVFDLIKSFRSSEKWRVRIEADKSLISLEFYSKGLDAALSMFMNFLKESCFQGQVKLAMHMMHLCEVSNGSDTMHCIQNSTLVAMLDLLASQKAFNNIFLRHYLFCILQVLSNRPPTLYAGVTKASLHTMSGVEVLEELKKKSSLIRTKMVGPKEPAAEPVPDVEKTASGLPVIEISEDDLQIDEPAKNVLQIEKPAENVLRTSQASDALPAAEAVKEVSSSHGTVEHVLPKTGAPKDDLPMVEAAKDVFPADVANDAQTISNSCERRVIKIRVKKPTARSKTDGDINMVGNPGSLRNEIEVGPSSSVSVEAPFRVTAIETRSAGNQIPEEVNSFRGQGSHTTASVGSAKVANDDVVGKEFLCTADSICGALPQEGQSPSNVMRSYGEDDTQKSSCIAVPTQHNEDKRLVATDGQESAEKEKKHKDKKRKKDKDHHNDPEYLERKRMKKEKRRLEKEAKGNKVQTEEQVTTTAEPEHVIRNTDLTVLKETSSSLVPKKEGSVEATPSTAPENRTKHAAVNPPRKVRIKIKPRAMPNNT